MEYVVAQNGDVVARPTNGTLLRVDAVYQGGSVGIRSVSAVDTVIRPSDGHFTAGSNSGYWSELRVAGTETYTRGLRDPTRIEAGPAVGSNDWANVTIDRCVPKPIYIDVPNTGSSEIVIFGSPYGTQEPAVELARFRLR